MSPNMGVKEVGCGEGGVRRDARHPSAADTGQSIRFDDNAAVARAGQQPKAHGCSSRSLFRTAGKGNSPRCVARRSDLEMPTAIAKKEKANGTHQDAGS